MKKKVLAAIIAASMVALTACAAAAPAPAPAADAAPAATEEAAPAEEEAAPAEEATEDAALLGFAARKPEIAGACATISDGATVVSLAASGTKAVLTGEQKDIDNAKSKTQNFIIGKAFTGFFSAFIQFGSKGSVSKFDADATAAFTNKVIKNNENEK